MVISTKLFRGIALGSGIVGVLALVAVALHLYGIPAPSSLPATVKESTYQAVLLDTDQVYFGHIQDMSSQFISLQDVYYIQVPQGTTQGRIVRLGDVESHGPENEMLINRDRILFWENLRPDSQIVQAIRAYRSN